MGSAGLLQRRWGCAPEPQFLVGFGGFAAKTNQKNFSGRLRRPGTPPP
jgi:hypothetical protein